MSMENMQSVVDVHVEVGSPSDGKRDKAVRKGRKGTYIISLYIFSHLC